MICCSASLITSPKGTLKSGCGLTSVFDQFGNTLRNGGTLTGPVVDAIQIQAQTLGLTGGYRIEETDTLDETTIARIAAISHDHLVKWTLLSATTL
jgi:hypothetical protein